MVHALKRLLTVIGIILFYTGLVRLVARLGGRTPKVLVYHACESAESDYIRGLRSNTTPAQFARHLDFLQRHYRPIPLTELEEGRIPKRAVIVTFDDGYSSVYREAFPLLAARRVPATVYLVTRSVGNEQLVWVNALMWLLNRHADACVPIARSMLGVPAVLREPREILEYVQSSYAPESVERALAAMYHAVGVDPLILARQAQLYVTWADVDRMVPQGITFGSHTATHANLRCLDSQAQRAEMEEALNALQLPGCLPSLAYPFGELNADSRHEAVALGHTSVLHVGGVNRPLDLHAVARVPVGDVSPARLFAEMEIVTPVITWLKHRLRRI